MNIITDLVLLPDVMALPKESLQEIATKLDLPDHLNSRDLAHNIWQQCARNSELRNKSLQEVQYKVFSGKTSVTWYQMTDSQTLRRSKESIIENCSFDPFKEVVIPDRETLTNSPVLIGAAYGETDDEYYLRFMYKSGVTQLFYGTELTTFPTSSVKTIYVNERANLIEVRTDSRIANRFASSLASLMGQEISMSQRDFLAPFGYDIERIADSLNGELIDATAKPELLLESFTDEQADKIIDILSALDDYFQEGNIEQLSENLQNAKDTFGSDLISVPFIALILNGMEKIGMGVSGMDLRQLPFYRTIRPHIQNQGGFIQFRLEENGIQNSYTIKVGVNTKSVYFMTPASEAAIRYVRERIAI